MIAPAMLAAVLAVSPPAFTLKPKPPVLTERQANAIEPCLKLNRELAAWRRQAYREKGAKAPHGQYAVIRRVGGCSIATPRR